MYIAFIAGVAIGSTLGAVFYYWWMRPDVKELKQTIRLKEQQIEKLVHAAMKKYHEDDA